MRWALRGCGQPDVFVFQDAGAKSSRRARREAVFHGAEGERARAFLSIDPRALAPATSSLPSLCVRHTLPAQFGATGAAPFAHAAGDFRNSQSTYRILAAFVAAVAFYWMRDPDKCVSDAQRSAARMHGGFNSPGELYRGSRP